MKIIQFNPNGGPLWANVMMTGPSFYCSYFIKYWSAGSGQKVLFKDEGNNQQAHDDHFKLVDPNNGNEPVSANNGRIIELPFTLASFEDQANYRVELEIYQGAVHIQADKLGSDDKQGTITKSDGSKSETLIIKLES